MTTITANTVLRSRNLAQPDEVVSTMLLRYPRWIHAEARTHRQLRISEDMAVDTLTPSPMEDENLSRNAASSRAIPVKKLIRDVIDDPAIPLFWGKNRPGMQATEEMSDDERADAETVWSSALNDAIMAAETLADIGAHKQIVNRLLEPFSHITVLVTATEWSNFLALRDHEDAEPHIRILAQEIRKCLEREDDIQNLRPGEWHTPFVSAEDAFRAHDYAGNPVFGGSRELVIIFLSAARCASTSYKTVEGFDMTIERAIAIHDKLLQSSPLHASPAEHVCQADGRVRNIVYPGRDTGWENPHQHGNLVGFRQYRKMLLGECL